MGSTTIHNLLLENMLCGSRSSVSFIDDFTLTATDRPCMIQHNLGMAYRDLPDGDCVENLKSAAAALENSRRALISRRMYSLQGHAEQDLQDVQGLLRELETKPH